MKTWTFNLELFLNLDKVLDISFSEIARRTGMHQPALNRYVQQEYVISVDTLIKICNALRMPFRYFVAENGVSIIPEREHATVTTEDWHKIQWHGKDAERIFYDQRLSWAKVAEIMGVAKGQSAKSRFIDGTRFPIDAFLTTCTKVQVSPFEFVADGNLSSHQPARKTERTPAEVTRLKSEVAELNARIDKLKEEHSVMRQKMDALLRRMEETMQKQGGSIYGPVLDSNRAIAQASEDKEPGSMA